MHGVLRGMLRAGCPRSQTNKRMPCLRASYARSHSKLPERSHITNPQTTSLINEHLAGVAASEPGRVSARIGAGCPAEGKARPARCGMRLSCCLLSIITLLDLCVACFEASCGQAARAPTANWLKDLLNDCHQSFASKENTLNLCQPSLPLLNCMKGPG